MCFTQVTQFPTGSCSNPFRANFAPCRFVHERKQKKHCKPQSSWFFLVLSFQAINTAAGPWGLTCLRYEIRDILLPANIRSAMERQVLNSLPPFTLFCRSSSLCFSFLSSQFDRFAPVSGDALCCILVSPFCRASCLCCICFRLYPWVYFCSSTTLL